MKLRKLLALAMAAVLAVSSASVAMADSIPVEEWGDLASAVANANDGDVIELAGDVTITSQLSIDKDITIKGNNVTINATGASDKNQPYGGSILITDANVKFDGVKIVGSYDSTRYVVQAARSNVTFSNCDISGGTYSAVLVNGSDAIFTNTTIDSDSPYDGDVELSTSQGNPSLKVQGGNIGNVYVDPDTLTDLGVDSADQQDPAKVAGVVDNLVDSDVELPLQIGVTGGSPIPGTIPATPASSGSGNNGNSNRSDNDDGGDYFGNETWDEVKREIAEAEEGDTIKVSATGLPYFPSSVARALKGKDITLEIRKNGVTYEVNGLEIGDIDKIWYEFDELETELLTADADSEAPAAEDEDKDNPDTGR